MSFKKWELSHHPCEKDENRWRLRLSISEADLMSLIGRLQGTIGRPFVLEGEDYDFGLYLYEVKDSEFHSICKSLKKDCAQGKIFMQDKKESYAEILDNILKEFDLSIVVEGKELVKEKKKEKPKKERSEEPHKKEKAEKKPHARSKEEKKAAPAESEAKPEAESEEAPRKEPQEEEDTARDEGVLSDVVIEDEIKDMRLNPRYTFEEFVIGPNNRFTAAAAQAVADNLSKIYNPFFIYGGVGLGKTHLMHAVGHYVHKKSPNVKFLYVTTEKFMGDVVDSIRHGAVKNMRDHYRKIDLLLIDDIQFLEESESTQEEFFHTFNALHQSGKQIIITSDRPPKQLVTLEDRLRSRFEWGLIADIKSPNLETRVAILKRKGEVEHVVLDDNILLYIASKLRSNIRELEGFLKRINAYASLTHQEVNMELVKTLMNDLLPEEDIEQHVPTTVKPPNQKVYVIKSPGMQQPDAPGQPVPPVPQPPQPAPPQTPQQPAPYNIQANIPSQPAAQPGPPPVQSTPVPTAPDQPVPPAPQAPPVQPAQPQIPQVQGQDDIVLISRSKPMPTHAPAPAPAPAQAPPSTPAEALKIEGEDLGLKTVEVAFFYPEGKNEELEKVKERFREVIKKHKLKFSLKGVIEQSFVFKGKVDYNFFIDLCKQNNVNITIVLGVPPEATVSSEEFSNILTSVMDEQKISLQLVPWSELNKDYRYLNLALDITLLRHKT